LLLSNRETGSLNHLFTFLLAACCLCTPLGSQLAAAAEYRFDVSALGSDLVPGADIKAFRTSVFGDGQAANGVEDSRIPLASAQWRAQGFPGWNLSAGTVHCDGALRGTAILLDTSAFGPAPSGHVLLTAAHILYDLESEQRYDHCAFHYMGLDHLPGYQARIDMETALLGKFRPNQPRAHLSTGQEDWALLHVREAIPAAVSEAHIVPMAYETLQHAGLLDIEFRLLAWSRKDSSISISLRCHVVESTSGDLGGGTWPGQLLDDCDSGQGASGGGLIATDGRRGYLVGIRAGAHWDDARFPAKDFPAGPPAGERWNIRSNTNFSRAVDSALIQQLRHFLSLLPMVSST
jgi:hypothetical protein